MIRFGLVGTNTSHAGAFAGIFNGTDGGRPALEGGRVVAVWGSTADGAVVPLSKSDVHELAQKHAIERIVAEPTDMIGAIDAVLVVDDVGGGASHGRLARPFLEAGIPTYIDKPMALSVEEAAELFDVAERGKAPLMSASALRYAVELAELKDRAQQIGKLSSVVSVGPGDWYYYGVHAVETFQTLVGPGATWVQRHAMDNRDIVVIGYDHGPAVVVETLRDARYLFHLTAYGADGWDACEVVDHRAFYTRMMAAALEMARTGVSPISRAETLEVLGVLEAGLRSGETGERVLLADVLPAR